MKNKKYDIVNYTKSKHIQHLIGNISMKFATKTYDQNFAIPKVPKT
jgi:hypothetical protein